MQTYQNHLSQPPVGSPTNAAAPPPASMASFVARLMSLNAHELQFLHADNELMRHLTQTQILMESRLQNINLQNKLLAMHHHHQQQQQLSPTAYYELASQYQQHCHQQQQQQHQQQQQQQHQQHLQHHLHHHHHQTPTTNTTTTLSPTPTTPLSISASPTSTLHYQQPHQLVLAINQNSHNNHLNNGNRRNGSSSPTGDQHQLHLRQQQIQHQLALDLRTQQPILLCHPHQMHLANSQLDSSTAAATAAAAAALASIYNSSPATANNGLQPQPPPATKSSASLNPKKQKLSEYQRQLNNSQNQNQQTEATDSSRTSGLSSSSSPTCATNNNNTCNNAHNTPPPSAHDQSNQHQNQKASRSSKSAGAAKLASSSPTSSDGQQQHPPVVAVAAVETRSGPLKKYKGEFDEPTAAEVEARQTMLSRPENYHSIRRPDGYCACVLGSEFHDKSVPAVLDMIDQWRNLDTELRVKAKWDVHDLPKDIPLAEIKKFEDLRRDASRGRADFGGASKRKPLGIRGTRQFLLILYCLWGHPGREDVMQKEGYCPHCFAKIKKANEQSTLVRVVNHFNMKHRRGANPRLSPNRDSTAVEHEIQRQFQRKQQQQQQLEQLAAASVDSSPAAQEHHHKPAIKKAKT